MNSRAYNDLFDNYGYNDNLVLLNLDNTFFLIMLFPMHYLVVAILNLFKNEKAQWLKDKIKTNFRYGFIITLLIEEFVLIFCSSMINMIKRDGT